MKSCAKYLLIQLFALAMIAACLYTAPENDANAQDTSSFTQQELDQMLAPVALYPDALLSQILMAATYPLEVVEAERWSVANPGLSGAQAVQAVEGNNWDPSVKSLVAFPQILRMMSSKLDWTERVGDAFLGQEAEVMNTVQDLRARAVAAGNLVSNAQARVRNDGDYIVIDQADPQVAYEPYYNPVVVYGSWWWPDYPPVYWAPWPGYSARAGYGNGFAWGLGIGLGAEFFYGAFDWRQHRVNVVNVNNYYHPRDVRWGDRSRNNWRHDPDHRRGAPYRAPAVRAQYNPSGAPNPSRSGFRGRPNANQMAPVAAPPRQDFQPGRNGPPDRGTGNTHIDSRNDTVPDHRVGNTRDPIRNDDGNARIRQANPTANRPPPQAAPRAPHALENIGPGNDARNASARGRASRGNSAQPPRAAPAPSQRAAPAPSQHAAPAQRPAPPAGNGNQGKGKGRNEK